MVLQQGVQLAANRCQVPRLDFNELLTAHDIHDEPIQLDFQLITRSRVPLFQCRVQ